MENASLNTYKEHLATVIRVLSLLEYSWLFLNMLFALYDDKTIMKYMVVKLQYKQRVATVYCGSLYDTSVLGPSKYEIGTIRGQKWL